MAKKPKQAATDPTPPAKRGKGQPIGYRPSAEVDDAMADYRRTKAEGGLHEFRPDKTVIIEVALRRYFRSLGYVMPEEPNDD